MAIVNPYRHNDCKPLCPRVKFGQMSLGIILLRPYLMAPSHSSKTDQKEAKKVNNIGQAVKRKKIKAGVTSSL